MGAGGSRGTSVVGKEEYAAWPLARVEAAFLRAQVVLMGSPPPTDEEAAEKWAAEFEAKMHRLSRRHFWEIFTDYSVVKAPQHGTAQIALGKASRSQLGSKGAATGNFLSLDVGIFSVFAAKIESGAERVDQQALDRKQRERRLSTQLNKQEYLENMDKVSALKEVGQVDVARGDAAAMTTINAYEVFLTLALFCKGDVEQQLGLAFDIFDVDLSNSMTLDEMQTLMKCLATASFKIGLTMRPGRDDELEKLTMNMFKVADSDSDEAITKEEFVKWARGHVVSKRLLNAFQKERSFYSTTRLQSLEDKSGLSLATVNRRERMRASQEAKVASKSMLGKLEKHTKFDQLELRRLRRVFAEVAGESGEFTRVQFVRVMSQEYPAMRGEAMARVAALSSVPDHVIIRENPQLCMLFDAFDEDLSGSMDFSEFTLGLSKLTRGTMDEKMSLLFECYDQDGDGTVSLPEIMKFVMRANDEVMEATEFAQELLGAIDRNGDGQLSKEEFVKAMADEPMLYECFFGSLIPTKTRVLLESSQFKAHMSTVTKRNSKFNVGFLRKLWAKCVDNGDHKRSMNRTAFRRFMMEEFECSSDLMPLVNRVFAAIDVDDSGTVDFKELFTGLGQVVMGDTDEKAAFFFGLYDADNSGDIDREEVVAMLASAKEAADTGLTKVTSALASLGAKGDGSVSLDEFQLACREDPTMLDTFGKLFGTESIKPSSGKGYVRTAPMSNKNISEFRKIRSLLDATAVFTAAAKRAKTRVAAGQKIGPANHGGGAKSQAMQKRSEMDTVVVYAKQRSKQSTEKGISRFRRLSLDAAAEVVRSLQVAAEPKLDELMMENEGKVVEKPPPIKDAYTAFDERVRKANQLDLIGESAPTQKPVKVKAKEEIPVPVYNPEAFSIVAKEHGRVLSRHFKRGLMDLRAAKSMNDTHMQTRARHAKIEARLAAKRKKHKAKKGKGKRNPGAAGGVPVAGGGNAKSAWTVRALDGAGSSSTYSPITGHASPTSGQTMKRAATMTAFPSRSMKRMESRKQMLKQANSMASLTGQSLTSGGMQSSSSMHSLRRPGSRQRMRSRSTAVDGRPTVDTSAHGNSSGALSNPSVLPPGTPGHRVAMQRKESMRASRKAVVKRRQSRQNLRARAMSAGPSRRRVVMGGVSPTGGYASTWLDQEGEEGDDPSWVAVEDEEGHSGAATSPQSSSPQRRRSQPAQRVSGGDVVDAGSGYGYQPAAAAGSVQRIQGRAGSFVVRSPSTRRVHDFSDGGGDVYYQHSTFRSGNASPDPLSADVRRLEAIPASAAARARPRSSPATSRAAAQASARSSTGMPGRVITTDARKVRASRTISKHVPRAALPRTMAYGAGVKVRPQLGSVSPQVSGRAAGALLRMDDDSHGLDGLPRAHVITPSASLRNWQ